MNVALCLSGFARRFDYPDSIVSMRRLIAHFDADVFIHTFYPCDERPYDCAWHYIQEHYFQWEFRNLLGKIYGDSLKQSVIEDYAEHILTLPNYKEYPNHTPHPNGVLSIFSMFDKMARCHGLLREHEAKTGKSYDVEIKSRTEIVFDVFPERLDFIKDRVIYTPDSDPRGNHNPGDWCGGIMDSCFMGTPATMDKVADIVNSWDEFRSKSIAFKHERVLRAQAEKHGLIWTTFPVRSRWSEMPWRLGVQG